MPDRLLNDRLDWNLLRTFRVIGQAVDQPRRRPHLTQPASARRSSAWKELGRQLIARRGPRFVLTEVGEQLFELAGEVYGQMSQIGGLLEQPADELVGGAPADDQPHRQRAFDDFLADFHRQHRGWSWRST
jgi:DNA-binding transcriptional LysR family regulator